MRERRASVAIPTQYLAELDADRQEQLRQINRPGIEALLERLEQGDALAFLGAGTSAPLYPLWGELVSNLIDASADRLGVEVAATCRALANDRPDAVVEIVRKRLGVADYRELLRTLFRPRRDPDSGRTWTSTQELVARCALAGIVTTNYDPGILNARMAVRPNASSTGFASWSDEGALDRWRTGDVFGDDELPVLYAHGHHNQPDAIVLATTEYRRAYGGKLARVLGRIVDTGHLVWIGFSFADRRIEAILREIAEGSGTADEPGGPPRHMALMPWDPLGEGGDGCGPHDPDVVRQLIETQFGSRAILYPAPNGDHAALERLLAELTDRRYAAAGALPAPRTESQAAAHDADGPGAVLVHWAHGGELTGHFTGRAEELAHLGRWARDATVRLVGVTAWGGTGKTTLVTQWVARENGVAMRSLLRGGFAWSFYEGRSAEHWAVELLAWIEQSFGVAVKRGSLANRVLSAARQVPLLLVLDGLEVMQEGPAAAQFGRLLDGTLRAVLTGLCERDHDGLVLLTSRFPFADLEQFDGGAARMLDLPPMTPVEGAELLASAGAGWMGEQERRDFADAVDGHALALSALASVLAERPDAADVTTLRTQLGEGGGTDTRVARVLAFYRDQLSEPDQHVAGIVSLFQRPVSVASVLELGAGEVIGAPLAGWTVSQVEAAVRQRLAGLLTWHADGTISAHPLVRDTFRPLVLSRQAAQEVIGIAFADVPDGAVSTREEALIVTEMVELLLAVDDWEAASNLYMARTDSGRIWRHLPAVRLGQRCSSAFVGSEDLRQTCRKRLTLPALAMYLNHVGLSSLQGADFPAAEQALGAALASYREVGSPVNVAVAMQNLCDCFLALGDVDRARALAAEGLPQGEEDRQVHLASMAYMAASANLAGDTLEAERWYVAADELEVRDSQRHLYSLRGFEWGVYLLQTGRGHLVRTLAEHNLEISERNGWNEDVARCRRLLAQCHLADREVIAARQQQEAAATTFRDGDDLLEWGSMLPEIATERRLSGAFDEAERLCTEAVALAGPRLMIPAHGNALAVRAHVRCDRFLTDHDVDNLERAGDDARLVLRLGTVVRRLPWLELAGLEALVRVDELAGRDNGGSEKAAGLRARLIPPELDPDPLTAIEAKFDSPER